jgi:multiple sugar transport system substrate-binding protein
MASNKSLSRRGFLKISATSAAALAAAGLPLGGRLFAAPGKQGTVTVTFMGWGGQQEDEGVRAAIAVFEQENPGIHVEWLQIPTQTTPDFTSAFLSNVAAGTPPDTSFVDSSNYETFSQRGLLMDITDRITSDELLGQPNYFFEPQEADRCADDNGRWHGIGSCWVAPHLYYNADLLDQAGITPPGFKDDEIWDWDTFVENAKLLTVDSNGRHPDDSGFDLDNVVQWGVQWPFNNWTFLASAVVSNGGDYTADGKSGLDSDAAIQAIQNVADLIYKHHVAPQDAALTSLGMSNTQMIDAGRLALAVDGSWALSWMNPTTVTNATLGTGALPSMAQPGAYIQAHFHSALEAAADPDAAWQWVRFLATPFYQSEFCKIGLWLPSQTSLTTEEGLASWLTEGIHPDNYKDLVTDYLPAHGVTSRIPPGYTAAFTNFINPAFEAINNGQAAADVLPEAVQQANETIAEETNA